MSFIYAKHFDLSFLFFFRVFRLYFYIFVLFCLNLLLKLFQLGWYWIELNWIYTLQHSIMHSYSQKDKLFCLCLRLVTDHNNVTKFVFFRLILFFMEIFIFRMELAGFLRKGSWEKKNYDCSEVPYASIVICI